MSTLLDFDAEDLDALGDLLDDGPDEGLLALTRSISGQYVEVIASFLRAAFHGEDLSLLQKQVEASIDALLRLASATYDDELAASLIALAALLPEARVLGGARRERYLRNARSWVIEFAALLRDEDADHLRALVKFDERSQPLLHRLMEVYGIGPKRLERLYCAGLFSVACLIDADPVEVSQVTGMSQRLARSVIHAAQRFDLLRRHAAARALLDRTKDAIALAREARQSGREDPGTLHAMRTAKLELELALAELVEEDP